MTCEDVTPLNEDTGARFCDRCGEAFTGPAFWRAGKFKAAMLCSSCKEKE